MLFLSVKASSTIDYEKKAILFVFVFLSKETPSCVRLFVIKFYTLIDHHVLGAIFPFRRIKGDDENITKAHYSL